VALKVLHPEMTAIPEIVARFEREAVAAARIDHPNVAQAMDFGHLDDGALYFVLEYVDGKSLRALLDEGPLGLGRALAIARQVADALVAAHEVGIVHRDLKPDNVMLVVQPDGTDRVKVLDFGIAKLSAGDGEVAVPGKTLTRVGVVMGTVGYMAPEQALGQAVSHLADLYAFGCVLYEMLSGHLPFVAADVTQILTKQLTEEPPPLPANVPKELTELVAHLLARNTVERMQTAVELADALESIIERRKAGTAPTAFIEEAAADVSVRSGRLAVAHTTAGSGAKRRPAWLGAGALLLVGAFVYAALRTTTSDVNRPSVEPSVSIAPPALDTAPPSASGTVEQASPEPSAPALPSSASPRASAEVKRAEPLPERGTGTTKTKKTRRTRVTEEHTVKRTRRRTGPGGIYIPPPSQWFK